VLVLAAAAMAVTPTRLSGSLDVSRMSWLINYVCS
jgi:hypothetical protein